MPIWIVKATWNEDDAEVSEQWEVNAPTGHEAIRDATTHIRFQPHHVEARHSESAAGLSPGEARRLSPEND